MRIENPDIYRNKISRREALIWTGLAAAYAGYRVYSSAIPRLLPSAPEVVDIESIQVEAGVVAIYKGVNIRTAPVVPDKTRFRQPNNRLDWDQIEIINGIQLDDKPAFLVVNPRIVTGVNTTDYVQYGFDWIKLDIQKKGEENVRPYYINHSINTKDSVKILGYSGYSDIPNGQAGSMGMYKFGSNQLSTEDIGRVIVPENLGSMAGDIMPKLWSERMRKQFEGKVPLVGRLVTNIPVVDTTGDKDNIRINVREYPSLQYGNGEEVKIIGTVAQATILNKVFVPPDDYYHYGFGAVRSEDLNGSLVDSQGNSIVPSPGMVYAIATPYLLVL